MTDNRVDASLSAEQVAEVQAAIATIKEKLPFLIGLSIEERVSMLKMGDRSRAFVDRTLELVKRNSDFLPRSFDVEEMERDVELMRSLLPIYQSLQQIEELVESTLMVVSSEAYAAALVAYRYAKESNLDTGLNAVLDDISRRFARRTRPAESTESAS